MDRAPTSRLPRAGEGATQMLRALLIPVLSDWHLLDMRWVREVVTEPLVTELPTAPHAVLGVFNLRGEIIPLFDTAALLGLGTVPSSMFAVVVESALGPAGLAATGVPEAVELGEPTGSTETQGTTAAYAIDLRIATLLDLDVLLAPPETARSASR
jgi:purine-binding chemotaxis protein CheW